MDYRNPADKSDESSSSGSTEYTDSSEDDASANYVFYRDRPEWKDVQPIVQDDGDVNIVRIAYTEKFSDVFDYLRAVLLTREKSERTLELVTTALKLNPANYTAWVYRFDIVQFLKIDLHDELAYISKVILKFSKNYQVWQYRQRLIEVLNDPSKELSFLADILDRDAKNYLAWRYRQWILKKFCYLMETEIEFVEKLILKDIKNNSAWNQRYFVINHLGYDSDQMEKEFQYTFDKIKISPNNESSWSFLKGLLMFNRAFKKIVHDFCNELYNKGDRSVHLISCLVDMFVEDENYHTDHEKFEFVTKLCFDLANVYDPIRVSYWTHIADKIAKKYNFAKEQNRKIDILNKKEK